MIIDDTSGVAGCDFCRFVNYDSSNDVFVYEIGDCKCKPSYSYGPIIRPRSVFHYVFSGSGKVVIDGKEFPVHGKQGFFIPAGHLGFYQASTDDPWSYFWIHMDGPMPIEIFRKAGLSANHPVFTSTGDIENFEAMLWDLKANCNREYYSYGKLFEICDYILTHSVRSVDAEKDTQLDYVKTIINYIHVMYADNITVTDIANACNLNRSYMTRLFKDACGYSVQDYIIHYRMKKAGEQLASTDNSVQNIAYAVGYKDIFTFSKAFKKHVGISPKEFRKNPDSVHIR